MVVIERSKRLIHNGYQVIPIDSTGKPLVYGFNKPETTYSVSHAKRWITQFPEAGIALVTGKNDICALDIDVDNVGVAKLLRKVILKKYPTLPIRSCNPPRFAFLFKVDDSLRDVGNSNSKSFQDNNGDYNCIEFLSSKSLTLYGKHRKTEKPYLWGNKLTPLQVHSDELPVLTYNDVKKIVNFFETKMAKCEGVKLVGKSTFYDTGNNADSDSFENAKAEIVYDEDDVDRLLSKVEGGEDYQIWKRVGMAIHKQYSGSKRGLLKWDQWSSQFEGYKSLADCRDEWRKFKEDGAVGMGTVAFMVKQNIEQERVEKGLTLDVVEKNWIPIAKGSEVGDMSKLANESTLHKTEMAYMYSDVMVTVQRLDGRTGQMKLKEVPIYDAWMRLPGRTKCLAKEYYPSGQRILKQFRANRRENYYNVYEATMCELVEEDNMLHIFKNHMEYMFPNEGDVEWMYTWMAQLLQEPHKRYRVAPLSIATSHGTGRGWLTELIQELVGQANMSTIGQMSDLVRDGAKNGYLNNTTLCVVPETYAGKRKYAVDAKLRNILGDNFANVDVKYGAQKDQQIFTRFFFQSNHIAALVISDRDTRIECFINRALPKSAAYYEELYNAKDKHPTFINQVYTFLMNYNHKKNKNWLKTSRQTPARTEVIKSSLNKTASAVFDFKGVVGDRLFTDTMMEEFVIEYMSNFSHCDGNDEQLNVPQYAVLIEENIETDLNVRAKTGIVTVRSFSPYTKEELKMKGRIKSSVNKSKHLIKQYFENHERALTGDLQ